MNEDRKAWYKKYLTTYDTLPHEVNPGLMESIGTKLASIQSDSPLVTLSVIAYNEERNLIACLWSLSDMKFSFPVEIIGVNNNSTDHTEEIYQKIGLPYYNEDRNSCGYARQCGLNHAKGKYHLNIDADTLYPPDYAQIMLKTLSKNGIVAASSSWSYLPNTNHNQFGLKCYETLRDMFLSFQSIKRPELSVRGLVFGYDTKLAKRIGIRVELKRGEDGSLALALKQHGKIAFIRDRRARAMTGHGTLGADGSLFNSFKIRLLKAIKSFPSLFSRKTHYKDEDSNLIDKTK